MRAGHDGGPESEAVRIAREPGGSRSLAHDPHEAAADAEAVLPLGVS